MDRRCGEESIFRRRCLVARREGVFSACPAVRCVVGSLSPLDGHCVDLHVFGRRQSDLVDPVSIRPIGIGRVVSSRTASTCQSEPTMWATDLTTSLSAAGGVLLRVVVALLACYGEDIRSPPV